jgi:hypothetical protein
LLFVALSIFASTSFDVSMEKKVNYNSWGANWDTVVVLKNNLTTIAIVPKIGGRVMQYDLGTHPSIYIDDDVKNTVPTDGNTLVGGFRQLASPQSDFNWPPSPVLDAGAYKCSIISNSADSCVVYLESKVENGSDANDSTLRGLQFKRTITLYKSSSHARVVMVMKNTVSKTLTHGIWDITQCDCRNNGDADVNNIWVYFPLNPQSTIGHGKGYVEYQGTDDSQWHKNIAPGIMGVQYGQVVAKIGEDSKTGWICFADNLDGYTYVKTFTYQEGKTYPDTGASVQVYTYSRYNVLEEEVLGPLTTLKQNDSVSLVENWYATRSRGPVLSVNGVCLTTKKLTAAQSHDSVIIQGAFGVFYPGKVKALFKTAADSLVMAADSYSVSPLDSFLVKKSLKIPTKAAILVLALYSNDGKLIGNLDSASIAPVNIAAAPKAVGFDKNPCLSLVKNGKTLLINAPYAGAFRLEIIGLDGKRLWSRVGNNSMVFSLPLTGLSSGVALVRAYHAGIAETKRIVAR